MSDTRGNSKGNIHRSLLRRSLRVGAVIIFVAAGVDYLSEVAMRRLHLVIALVVLLLLVAAGAFADLVGTAVTAASEEPFHAMAAKRLHGARQGLWLIRRADSVAHVLNDILGDIAGTISGAAAVTVAMKLAGSSPGHVQQLFATLGVGVVTALTVGGKGYAKGYAMANPERVIFQAGRLLYAVEHYLRVPITHRRRQSNGRAPSRGRQT